MIDLVLLWQTFVESFDHFLGSMLLKISGIKLFALFTVNNYFLFAS